MQNTLPKREVTFHQQNKTGCSVLPKNYKLLQYSFDANIVCGIFVKYCRQYTNIHSRWSRLTLFVRKEDFIVVTLKSIWKAPVRTSMTLILGNVWIRPRKPSNKPLTWRLNKDARTLGQSYDCRMRLSLFEWPSRDA